LLNGIELASTMGWDWVQCSVAVLFGVAKKYKKQQAVGRSYNISAR
jgi:hypothetical protein